MKVVIDVSKHLYNNIVALSQISLGRIEYKGIIAGALRAIRSGTVLPENLLILDKDKLEKDCDYDGYYDEFCAYSDTALEAAEIGEDDGP